MHEAKKVFIAAAVMMVHGPANAAGGGVWKACTIDTVTACTPDACASRKPAISIFVSDYVDGGAERGAYYRCKLHLTACDRFPATVYRSGDFMIFSLPGESAFAKLGADDRVTDVAVVGYTVFVSRGRCAERAPPPGSM